MNKKKIRNFVIVIILCLLIVYVFGGNIGEVKLEINQDKGDVPVGELLKNYEIKQTFTLEQNNLIGLSIKLATFARVNSGHIIIGIKDAQNNSSIYTTKINTESINDNDYLKIRFPPIKYTKGKSYYLYVKSLDGTPGQAITFYKSSEDTYSNGELYINGEKQAGDAVFQIYYNDTLVSRLLGF